MNFKITCLILILSVYHLKSTSQEKLSVEGGVIANTMFNLKDYPMGLGAKIDLNYIPFKSSFFTLSIRGKYIHYNIDETYKYENNDDGSSSLVFNKNPYFTYNISVPQVGFVPKLFYKVDDDMFLFFENDFSIGYVNGNVKYRMGNGYTNKKIKETKFIYAPSVGIGFRVNKVTILGSEGWNFLDFRPIIIKHAPQGYQGNVSRQDTGILLSISVSMPIIK